MPPRAVPNPVLYRRLDPGLLQGLGERLPHVLDVLGVDIVEGEGPNHLFGPVAENALHRRANVADGAAGLKDHHDIRRVLHQGAKPALTPGRSSDPRETLTSGIGGIQRAIWIVLCGVHPHSFSARLGIREEI